MNEPVIVLDKLSKRFGDVQAVREVSLTIAAGTIFGFLGANGAGKTTTMRMLCGLTHPTGGTATIAGHSVWQERQLVRAKFGYVAQRFSLYPDLTVEENFRFFGGACRVPVTQLEERIANLLRLADLEEKRDTPAGSLSGGMRQLLALGCALVHDPPLLFLDEPTSGLDPVHRQQIWNLLYDLSSRGKTIFVTTHYMDEAERCTEVGFIESGRLLAKASPRALKSSFRARASPLLRFSGRQPRPAGTALGIDFAAALYPPLRTRFRDQRINRGEKPVDRSRQHSQHPRVDRHPFEKQNIRVAPRIG